MSLPQALPELLPLTLLLVEVPLEPPVLLPPLDALVVWPLLPPLVLLPLELLEVPELPVEPPSGPEVEEPHAERISAARNGLASDVGFAGTPSGSRQARSVSTSQS